jgi:hypothetical protein
MGNDGSGAGRVIPGRTRCPTTTVPLRSPPKSPDFGGPHQFRPFGPRPAAIACGDRGPTDRPPVLTRAGRPACSEERAAIRSHARTAARSPGLPPGLGLPFQQGLRLDRYCKGPGFRNQSGNLAKAFAAVVESHQATAGMGQRFSKDGLDLDRAEPVQPVLALHAPHRADRIPLTDLSSPGRRRKPQPMNPGTERSAPSRRSRVGDDATGASRRRKRSKSIGPG